MEIKKGYKSPFKGVKVSRDGKAKIEKIKNAYDELYRNLHFLLRLENDFYMRQASIHLQESCHWYVKACAMQNEDTDDKSS